MVISAPLGRVCSDFEGRGSVAAVAGVFAPVTEVVGAAVVVVFADSLVVVVSVVVVVAHVEQLSLANDPPPLSPSLDLQECH